jgi:hypothetical protein
MPVTINGSSNPAHQKHCGDKKTGPQAWKLTPEPQLD